MKHYKIIISIIICALLSGGPIVAKTENPCVFDEYIYRYLVSNENEFKNVSSPLYMVGSNIPVYDIYIDEEEKNRYKIREDFYLIPVFNNNNLVCMVLADSEQVTVCNSYNNTLRSYLESGLPFVVACYDDKAYIANSTGRILIEDYHINKIKGESIKTDFIDYLLSLVPCNITKRHLNTGYAATREGHQINVPNVLQNSDTTCWAACIACWVRYYEGSYISCTQVANEVGTSNMQTPAQVVHHLDYHFGIDAINSTYINMSYIRTRLSNDVLFMVGWTYPGYAGHMTVLCGWEKNSNNTYTYKVMDPDTGTKRNTTISSDGTVKPRLSISNTEFFFTEKIEYEGLLK